MLEEESGIDPAVIAARGYFTARNRTHLTGLPKYARRYTPALVMPMLSPDGETVSYQTRPDKSPVLNGKKSKYLSAKPTVIDVHPAMLEEVRSGDGAMWVTEGLKKGDALTSHGLAAVTLAGVWMFAEKGSGGKKLLPCFDHVRLEGRTVNVVYDSDVMTKESVQLALERLTEALEKRGAVVRVVYLPDAQDGSKQGVDDWLVNGGTVGELQEMPQEFVPADVGEIRLAKDDKLRAAVENAWKSWYAFDWYKFRGTEDKPNWQRGHSARDVEEAAIDTAAKSGVVVEDGIYFSLNSRTWSELARAGKQTVLSSIKHLEAENRIRREKAPGNGKAAGYVLLTSYSSSYQVGETGERSDSLRRPCDSPGTNLSKPTAPRLRWSAPVLERNADGTHERGYIRRLAKHNGSVVDHLERAGGSMEIHELAESLGKRVDNLKYRNLKLLKERGIVAVENDVVSLVADWSAALEEERERSGEISADHKTREKHAREREAYRNRHNIEVNDSPTEVEMDERRDRVFEERKRRAAEQFARERSGPRINLENWLAGRFRTSDALVCSVLQALGEPWDGLEDWREAVVEAAEDQRDEVRDGPRRAKVIEAAHRFRRAA